MNIRKIYLGLMAVLSVALFYEWTSGNKADSVISHLETAKIESLKPQVSEDGLYVRLENDLLKLKIAPVAVLVTVNCWTWVKPAQWDRSK